MTITPPQVSNKCQKDCLEMKEYDEEKDKDYYFIDAISLVSLKL